VLEGEPASVWATALRQHDIDRNNGSRRALGMLGHDLRCGRQPLITLRAPRCKVFPLSFVGVLSAHELRK
jgi:hypothetical protein